MKYQAYLLHYIMGWMNLHTAVLLEFNSHDKEGKTIDVSKRNKYVRQLDGIKDAGVIGRYSNAS